MEEFKSFLKQQKQTHPQSSSQDCSGSVKIDFETIEIIKYNTLIKACSAQIFTGRYSVHVFIATE
jgi:hypothetical protein